MMIVVLFKSQQHNDAKNSLSAYLQSFAKTLNCSELVSVKM
jgi:hypothetical protein